MRRRRGYSLIETLLVISAMAVVFGLCASMIHGLLRLDRAGRARLNEAATLSRLARQFRQDVRAASTSRSSGKDDPRQELVLSVPPDRAIEYRWSKGRVLRAERAPGRADRHETYRLPDRAAPRFQVLDEHGVVWVSLGLDRKPDIASLIPSRGYRVVARLGKDRGQARAGGDTP